MLSMVPLMIGISALVFLLMYLSPGDFLSEARNSKDISPEIVKQEEIRLGLDKPWYVQYGRWLNSVSPLKTSAANIRLCTSAAPTSDTLGAIKYR